MKFFICETCGNLAEMIAESGVEMMCCDTPMKELETQAKDGAAEKHVPVIRITGNKVTVTVGEVNHPMTDAHYIEWIALETKKGTQMKTLIPGELPCKDFLLTLDDQVVAVYAYCNIHGLWKA